MNVALIIERALPELGGAERSVFEMAEALEAIGHRVEILAAAGRAAPNVRILCRGQPRKRTGFFRFAGVLRDYLARNKYDIVHSTLPFDFADVYQPRGGTYAEAARRNAASYVNPALVRLKELTLAANVRRSLLLSAERSLASGGGGPVIAALSKYVAEQFKRHYGTPDGRIAVIPNGVKPPEADEASAMRLRRRLYVYMRTDPGEAALFLFAANNFRLKGLASLIEAARAAEDLGPARHICLVVAGSGRRGPYRRTARRMAVQRIAYVEQKGGLDNLLAAVDAAVLPTFYDPSSRFILEALAAGKPVITTAFNGAADMFVDGRHGRVIEDPRDVDALADALRFFSARANIEAASRAILEDGIPRKVSIENVARRLDELYGSIAGRRSGGKA
jgi:glycosyltransferase involved in cell wall biosynthesis